MTTAAELVRDTLQIIGVQAAEQPIQPNEFTDTVTSLNDLMAELEGDGISLGYTVVTTPSDIITVQDAAIGPIKKILAVDIAPEYDFEPSITLLRSADKGLKLLYKLSVTLAPVILTNTLPIGSGNEWPTRTNRHFFPDSSQNILDEFNGNIILEDNTANETS